jgi:hypothetical protein
MQENSRETVVHRGQGGLDFGSIDLFKPAIRIGNARPEVCVGRISTWGRRIC